MSKKEKTEKFRYIVIPVYFFFLAAFAGVIIWLVSGNGNPSLKDVLADTALTYESGWVTEDGGEADISKLNALGYGKYEEFSIYNTLPENLNGGQSLYFRSKNIYYSVYVDGRCAYDPEVPDSVFYTDAFGTRWNCIPLLPEDGGKQVEIRITTVYSGSRASIDNICLGDSGGLILGTIGGRLVAFITSILLLFTSLILILADIPINMLSRKNHELLYLGIFALTIAAWCMAETNLIQLYFDDSRLMQFVSCTSLMLTPVPVMLYLNSAFGFKRKWLTPLVCILSEVQVVVCWALHFMGIADIHDTLTFTHVVLGLAAVIMLSVNIRNTFFTSDKKSPVIYRILRGSGLVCLSVSGIIDIIRFYHGSSDDAAMFGRIGLLMYIIFYGISSLENTVKAVKLGVKTEIVSHLAYSDGLTGIGNRTAFMEQLSYLENNKNAPDTVGIIMFDVNDLKYVNDNLGHQSGDDMLIKSAEIINACFEGRNGSCYRIGGDEFVVILSGDNILRRYEQGIEVFRTEIGRHNEIPDKEFTLSIAHGFALYDRNSGEEGLMEVYQQADMKMYENKKEIKAGRKQNLERAAT